MANAVTTCLCCARSLPAGKGNDYGEHVSISCACCGNLAITSSAVAMLTARLPQQSRELEPLQRASLIHRVRRASSNSKFLLDSNTLTAWLDDPQLPSPLEQIENLVLWLAGELRNAGQSLNLTVDQHQAVVGALNAQGFSWVLKHTVEQGWIEGTLSQPLNSSARVIGATLTLTGWQLAEQIRKTGRPTKLAFIAMKFGEAELEAFVRDHLAPAVRTTGFELRALNESQPAGLIDDQLRVAIRRARFVLVELTHGNRGAYWEAGFAEGLGKPVIYLCRSDVFNDAKHSDKPHFDTNHLVTIIWDPADLAGAAKRLAACIRATLPDEAQMGEA